MVVSFDCHQCCFARNKYACSILIDVAKCPVKYKRKPFILILELGLGLVCISICSEACAGVTVLVPLRTMCPYCSPDLMVN